MAPSGFGIPFISFALSVHPLFYPVSVTALNVAFSISSVLPGSFISFKISDTPGLCWAAPFTVAPLVAKLDVANFSAAAINA